MAVWNIFRFVLLWVLSLLIAVASWRFVAGVELTMPHMVYHWMERPLAFYAHVGLAPVALALLPFQFWSTLRLRNPGLHRWLGRLYGLAILISGIGGLVLAIQTEAGQVAAYGFGILAVFWLCATSIAIWHAMNRRIALHRNWMIRSAALTLAAVTLRVFLPFLAMTFGFETGYMIVAWLCWVPNVLIAEFFLRRHWRSLAPA